MSEAFYIVGASVGGCLLIAAFLIVNHKLNTIMTKQEKFDAAIERLNATTNDIAADLTLLKEQAATGTISDESLAKLDTHIATLEALGASTENPVPETPEEGEAED